MNMISASSEIAKASVVGLEKKNSKGGNIRNVAQGYVKSENAVERKRRGVLKGLKQVMLNSLLSDSFCFALALLAW